MNESRGKNHQSVPPEVRKFKVSGDHIEPGFDHVVYGSEDELLFALGDDFAEALKCMTFEGDTLTLTVTLIRMTDEALADMPEYDP